MTAFLARKELKLVVVGDVGCGKANFIKKFLEYYPPFLDIQRDACDIYLSRIQDRSITIPVSNQKIKFTCNSIWFYNINDVKIISDPEFYDELDVIFYCYASDHPESFQNLDNKWIPQLKAKANYTFLVANLSTEQNLDQQEQRLISIKQAKRLKKRFHLRCFAQHTDDYCKLFTILDYFVTNALSRLYQQQLSEIEMDTDNKGIENLDEKLTENVPECTKK